MSGGKGGTDSGLPADDPFIGNPIAQYLEDTGTYPSNSQSWWWFKRPVTLDENSASRTYAEVFDTAMRYQLSFGNTPAPKGHYILNAFNLDRTGATGIPGLVSETSRGARPSQTAFYAGRAWYAGVSNSKYGSNLYFSQIIVRDEQVGMCHQQQDPTEEDAPDLLATDGGVVTIPALAACVKLFPTNDSLFVFGSNGVWRIAGSEGIGFKATDFSVTQISETPALSALSFVSVDGAPMWWNRSGIWTVQATDGGLNYQVQNITDPKIKDFFRDTIPDESKKYAKGAYNHATRIVQWLWRSTAPETLDEKFQYDRILNLQVQSGAFYPWSNSAPNTAQWKGIIAIEGEATEVATETVTTVDKESVYTTSGELVTSDVILRSSADNVFKYLTYLP